MRNIFLILTLLFTISSCSKHEYFEIEDVKNIVVSGGISSAIDIDMDMKFSSSDSFKFTAKKMVLNLIVMGDEVVVTAKLREKVKISDPKEYVTIPLRLEFNNGIFGVANILSRIKRNKDIFSIKGYIVVRKGLISHRIKLDDVKISDIIDKM